MWGQGELSSEDARHEAPAGLGIRELPRIGFCPALCARQTQRYSLPTFTPCTTSPASAKCLQEAGAALFALQPGICRGFPGGRCNLSPGLPGELPASRSVVRPQRRPFATFIYPNRIYEQRKSQRPPYSLASGHRSPGFLQLGQMRVKLWQPCS